MIKVPKRITARLLRRWRIHNRFLAFAIEILMVTLGILIAMQVNNWNERRKAHAVELQYLANLREDLLRDTLAVHAMQSLRAAMARGAQDLLHQEAPRTEQQLRDFNERVNLVYSWQRLVPHDNTLTELISSGRLATLSSPDIKHGLLSVEERHRQIRYTRDHMRREYEHYLYDVATTQRTLFPYVDFEHLLATDSFRYATSRTSGELETLYDEAEFLLNDLTTRNGLKLAIFNNHQMKVLCAELLALERTLIKDIDRAIEGK